DVRVRGARVDDEDVEPGRERVERDGPHRAVTAVEEDRRALDAAQGRRLVEVAGARASDLVLGTHARPREQAARGVVEVVDARSGAEVEVERIDERDGRRGLESSRAREPCTE